MAVCQMKVWYESGECLVALPSAGLRGSFVLKSLILQC